LLSFCVTSLFPDFVFFCTLVSEFLSFSTTIFPFPDPLPHTCDPPDNFCFLFSFTLAFRSTERPANRLSSFSWVRIHFSPLHYLPPSIRWRQRHRDTPLSRLALSLFPSFRANSSFFFSCCLLLRIPQLIPSPSAKRCIERMAAFCWTDP